MTEQYEQITDWNGFMEAWIEDSIYFDRHGGKEKLVRQLIDLTAAQAISEHIPEGAYYRKVEPEQVELVEWDNHEGDKFAMHPDEKPDSSCTKTGYIIKGVRVKA